MLEFFSALVTFNVAHRGIAQLFIDKTVLPVGRFIIVYDCFSGLEPLSDTLEPFEQ